MCWLCGGEGTIVTCCDDMCRGLGECIHGDGEAECPVCLSDSPADCRRTHTIEEWQDATIRLYDYVLRAEVRFARIRVALTKPAPDGTGDARREHAAWRYREVARACGLVEG